MAFDFNRLLDPRPLPLEMGFQRLASGVLHVAARTDLHGCSGAMFEWWFGSQPGDREYRWWHPIDHISSAWPEGVRGKVIGGLHAVKESLAGTPPVKLNIQFRDPAETFEPGALEKARASGAVSGLVCGHGAPEEQLQRTPDGRVLGARLVHLCRDTPWGAVLRSHFLLGCDLPGVGMPPEAVRQTAPDEMGPALLQHCYEEFTFLSRILPPLYAAEGQDQQHVSRPW